MAEHVVVNIIHKEDEAAATVEDANVNLNVNLDQVKVHTDDPYVSLEHASGDEVFEGSKLYNGDGILFLELNCGDQYKFTTEELIAVVLKAAQLPVAKFE